MVYMFLRKRFQTSESYTRLVSDTNDRLKGAVLRLWGSNMQHEWCHAVGVLHELLQWSSCIGLWYVYQRGADLMLAMMGPIADGQTSYGLDREASAESL